MMSDLCSGISATTFRGRRLTIEKSHYKSQFCQFQQMRVRIHENYSGILIE